jgi:hypothetical protein
VRRARRWRQAAGQLDVFSCSSRDVHLRELGAISEALESWHTGSVQLMGAVSTELGRFKEQAEVGAARSEPAPLPSPQP